VLSLHHQQGKLRRATNLIPTGDGTLGSRPGATQIVAGEIDAAAPWGNRLLLEKQSRIVVWDGQETDIAAAGQVLQASPYQALTANAQREDRLYIADGTRPLWYLAYRNGGYVAETVVNSVRDAGGVPYDIPTPNTIATWRSRLWIGYGQNRVQHCQNNDPGQWDPLWTVELQGKKQGRVNAMFPLRDTLAVGLTTSVWGIAGTSQYNWQRDEMFHDAGTAGPRALAGTLDTLYWLTSTGLFSKGGYLANDIRDAFAPFLSQAELAIDGRRRLLLCLMNARLFVMHLDQPGTFGEIDAANAYGLFTMDDYTGWYGPNGAWVLGELDSPDRSLDGTDSDFTSVYDTWEDTPNPHGNGRAVLNRIRFVVRGSPRGSASYTSYVDGKAASAAKAFTLSDISVNTWAELLAGTATGQAWPVPPVHRELAPRRPGRVFRHVVESPVHIEIVHAAPEYRFGEEE